MDWYGNVYSDSQVTIGRFSGTYKKFNGIPYELKQFYQKIKDTFMYWGKIKFILVGGHPTLKELSSGKNKKGIPVSKHNVWCDKACQAVAKEYLEKIKPNNTEEEYIV
jgi:hypothetical protein